MASLWRDTRAALRGEPWLALAIVTLAAGLLRASLLDMPIRLDEATTFNEFVLQPWRVTLGKYWATNNHPLHSVLAKISVDLLGRDPWVLRIPAFVAGVLLVPVTFLAGERMFTRSAAWYAAAGVGVLAPFLLFSANARGYSLVALIALLQWLAVRDAVRTNRRTSWALVAMLGAAGVYTHLTMAFAYAGNLLWALAWMARHRGEARSRLVPAFVSGAASVVMAVILYLPYAYVSGVAAVVANDNVSARSLDAFAERGPVLLWRLGDSWTNGMPLALAIASGVVAVVALLLTVRSRDVDGRAPLMIVLAFVLVIGLTLRLPPPRSALYLLPFILVALGALVDRVAKRTTGWRSGIVWGIAAVPFVVVSFAHATSSPVRRLTETGWMPEAQPIYARLRALLKPGDAVASLWLPRDILRYYYLRDAAGRAPLVPEVCPAPPATLYLLVRRGETVPHVLRYNRLTLESEASAVEMETHGRYTIWRAPVPAGMRCPERLGGPVDES